MLIILEGADKTGKTTLAKMLAKVYKLDYHHFGPPGDDPMKEYVDFFKGLTRFGVCDRYFIGCTVYGPLLRNAPVPPWREVVTLCRLLRRYGVYAMLANPSVEIMEKRFKKSKKEYVTWEQNLKARDLFLNVWSTLPIGFRKKEIILNETYDDMLDIVNQMRAVIEHQRRLYDIVKNFTGIGTTDRAAFVLVGEQINPNTTRFNLPFDSGPASEFLGMILNEAKVQEEDIYLANQDVLTEKEVEYHAMLGSFFVALGKKAEKTLRKKFKVECMTVEHPQYVRRFKSGEWKKYRDALEFGYQQFQESER